MSNIRNTVRKALRIQESVATTIYHDFYGNRTGVNNRIPVCPQCNLPVKESFYGHYKTEGRTCKCNPLLNEPTR